ncbi:MAG: DNA polymerase III subunit gamma/tau [Bacteroidales bacterium]
MDPFVVSARKYRPDTFDMVVGQQSITNTLKNAIRNNHVAQAFLFCGPRGIGKTTCARILAKTINCENITENIEACNVCESCQSFNQSHSFNIHELDAASNNSVDGIRTLVDQVRIPPQVGKYKVYIIDEVHMLSQQAFNAFLKTLEEPPAYAKFILATTEKQKIIPTILSRCQIFDFARITVNDITRQLAWVAEQEGIEADYNALHLISQKADGAMRDALSIFDQLISFTGSNLSYQQVVENLNILDYDYFFRITDLILEENSTDILLLINEILLKGFDGDDLITGLAGHFRNLMVCKDPATITLIEAGDDIREKYKAQSERCPEDFLMGALEITNKADVQYKTSSSKRLLLELTMLQTVSLVKKKALTQT